MRAPEFLAVVVKTDQDGVVFARGLVIGEASGHVAATGVGANASQLLIARRRADARPKRVAVHIGFEQKVVPGSRCIAVDGAGDQKAVVGWRWDDRVAVGPEPQIV